MNTYTLIFDSIANAEGNGPKYRFMAKEDGHEEITSTKSFLDLSEAISFARQLSFDNDMLKKMEAALRIDETFIFPRALLANEDVIKP